MGAVLGFRWRWEQGCPPTAETAGLPGRPWPVTRPFPRGWLPGSRELICYLLGRLPEPPPPRPCLFSASPTPPPPAPPSETETSGTPGPASRQPSWVPARVYLLWGGPGGLGGAAESGQSLGLGGAGSPPPPPPSTESPRPPPPCSRCQEPAPDWGWGRAGG